nr:enoyl-CoA hydratase/isomerase family protein [Pseudopedobacter sp.]
MKYENILVDKKEEILWITINRESKLNALNKPTLDELNDAIFNAQNDTEIGGIIITGAGEKAFVAGADISEFSSYNNEEGKVLAKKGHDKVFNLIANSPKPVIAAINGFALGGGLELTLACQIRIASENAKLGLPEVTLGLIPGYGGTQRLTQLVGRGKAMEMILTADMINAESALSFGLVNQVVPLIDLLATSEGMMKKILSRSPKAVKAAITAINASLDSSINGFEVEIEEFGNCFGTDDFKEGVAAFLEKRKANFKRD